MSDTQGSICSKNCDLSLVSGENITSHNTKRSVDLNLELENSKNAFMGMLKDFFILKITYC